MNPAFISEVGNNNFSFLLKDSVKALDWAGCWLRITACCCWSVLYCTIQYKCTFQYTNIVKLISAA